MIRFTVFGLCSLAIISSCSNKKSNFDFFEKKATPIDTVLYSESTTIRFRDTFLDVGNVKEGEEINIVYHYTNTGEKPLMLFNVSPSCGCTIADFSSKPLPSSHSDSIIAKFNSEGKDGPYQKSIKVNCNTEQKVYDLTFKVNVIKN